MDDRRMNFLAKAADSEELNYGTTETVGGAFMSGALFADDNPAWVNVKDELPETKKCVWVVAMVRGRLETFETIRLKSEQTFLDLDENGFVVNSEKPIKVLYWMYEPKLPHELRDKK